MGNCCNHSDKLIENDQESVHETIAATDPPNAKFSSQSNRNDIINSQSQSHNEGKREETNNNISEIQIDNSAQNQLYGKSHSPRENGIAQNMIGMNGSGISNSENLANIQSKASINKSNNIFPGANQSPSNGIASATKIGSNQNIANNSFQEIGSIRGQAKKSTLNPSKDPKEFLGNQEISSLKELKVDQQAENHKVDIALSQYLVNTEEQLTNNSIGKYIFMCCSNSTKSFILSMPHTKAQQPNSMKLLFDLARQYVLQVHGTEAISLELLFGMQNLSKSVLQNSDCFPAFFKTREVFEESYPIQIQIPSLQAQKKGNGTSEWTQLHIFSSMTSEDAKKEICPRQELGLSSINCVLYRFEGNPSVSVGETPPQLIPMLDEEKFGINMHDACFALKNIEEDSGTAIASGSTMPDGVDLYWVQAGDGQEIPLAKKGDQQRKIGLGVNIEYECKGSSCKLAGKKMIKNAGLGLLDLFENQKPSCEGCKSIQSTQILQIAFFQCKFAFSGISDLKKKFSNKWGVALSPSNLKKLQQKDLDKKYGTSNQSWNALLSEWTRFKIYSKRLAPPTVIEDNDEILHTLQMEEASSHKICGVCKQNVTDQMQHTLDCGHSYHKICINLLPSIFSSLKCPLCVRKKFLMILLTEKQINISSLFKFMI